MFQIYSHHPIVSLMEMWHHFLVFSSMFHGANWLLAQGKKNESCVYLYCSVRMRLNETPWTTVRVTLQFQLMLVPSARRNNIETNLGADMVVHILRCSNEEIIDLSLRKPVRPKNSLDLTIRYLEIHRFRCKLSISLDVDDFDCQYQPILQQRHCNQDFHVLRFLQVLNFWSIFQEIDLH